MKKLLIILLVLISTTAFADVSAGLDINDGNGTSFFGIGFFLNSEQLKGVQLTAGLNLVREEVFGAQIGLANIAGYVKGGQLSLANWSGHFKGVQLALANRADNFDGAQMGLLNWSSDFTGTQIGLANFSGSYTGTKIGLFNKSSDVNGIEIGLLNWGGKMQGVSIGLVNIYTEESADVVPIGLLNIINGGIFDLAAYVDINGMMYQQLETGSRYVYSILLHGTTYDDLNILKWERDRLWGAGIATRFNAGLVDVDAAIIGKNIVSLKAENNYERYWSIWVPEARLSASLNLGIASLFAGAGVDLKIYGYNDESFVFENREAFLTRGNVDFIPNAYAGVKIHF